MTHRASDRGAPRRFRAEVYDADDPKAPAAWSCPHEHSTAIEAHACGADWIASQREAARD